MRIDGMRVIESVHAVRRERTFPESENRSRRQHKKLVKRFGAEFRLAPAAYVVDGSIVIHPEYLKGLKSRVEERKVAAS